MKDDLIDRVQKDVTNEQKYRDGIPQIGVGVFLVISMLMMMFGKGNAFVVFIPLMPILIESLRRRITYPRVGYARIKESKAGGKAVLWAVFAMLVVGGAVFVIRMAKPSVLPQASNPHFLMMWATAIMVILLGVIFLTRRRSNRLSWSLIAVLLIIAAILVFKLHKDTVYMVVMAFGATQTVAGLLSLRSFIRDFPVLTDDE